MPRKPHAPRGTICIDNSLLAGATGDRWWCTVVLASQVNARGEFIARHSTERAALRQAGKLPGREVIEKARARPDGKALRGSDGAVLKHPYGARPPARPFESLLLAPQTLRCRRGLVCWRAMISQSCG